MSDDLTPNDPTQHINMRTAGTPLSALADRAEDRLRSTLATHYDRPDGPTEKEIRWARSFPKRIEDEKGEPRLPTLSEMRDRFGWGATDGEKERYGEAFVEQRGGSSGGSSSAPIVPSQGPSRRRRRR